MSISGRSNFTLTRTQIIDSALRLLGVLPSGDTVTNDSNLETDCVQALNLMVKSWENLGMQMWLRKDKTIEWEKGSRSQTIHKVDSGTGLASAGDVDIDPPQRIVHVNRRSSNTDTIMINMTKDEYNRQSSKFSNGTPVQYYYNNEFNKGELFVWPVPSSNTNIIVTYLDQLDTLTDASNILEMPSRWLEAVKYNLAVRLAPEFGIPASQEVVSLAVNTLQNAHDEGYEEGSIKIRPNFKSRMRR